MGLTKTRTNFGRFKSNRRSHIKRVADDTGRVKDNLTRLFHSNGECVLNNTGLFALVSCERADGRARAGVATGIGDFASEEFAQPRFDETPCAHVFRFFLAPHKLRGFGE